MYDEISGHVSKILKIDLEEINDIELIEDPFYAVTVDGSVYTYNINTKELKAGIHAVADMQNMLTDQEKAKHAEEDMNLIHYVLKGITKNNIPYEELYSVGSLGFAKALNGFRKNKGTKFSTFAVYCIKNEVLFYLKKEQKHLSNCSLDQTLFEDGNGHDLLLGDVISEEDMGKKSLEEILDNDYLRETLLNLLSKLSPEEQEIMASRYGLLGEKKTQVELAKKFNMTQANISKIQQNCLKKLYIYLKLQNQRVNY